MLLLTLEQFYLIYHLFRLPKSQTNSSDGKSDSFSLVGDTRWVYIAVSKWHYSKEVASAVSHPYIKRSVLRWHQKGTVAHFHTCLNCGYSCLYYNSRVIIMPCLKQNISALCCIQTREKEEFSKEGIQAAYLDQKRQVCNRRSPPVGWLWGWPVARLLREETGAKGAEIFRIVM